MKLLKITYLILFIYGCVSIDKIRPAKYEMVIDGKSDDWPHLIHFDKEIGFMYGLTYDQDNLYVLANIYNDEAKRKVMANGLMVWVDPNGKKRKNIGVKYPVLEIKPRKGRRRNRLDTTLRNSPVNRMQLENIMVKGVTTKEMITVKQKDLKVGLEARIGFNSARNLLYELKIPSSFLISNAKGELENIAVGFEWPSNTYPLRTGTPSMRGRGGMRPGGGGGRGRAGGSMNSATQNRRQNQSKSVWYKVLL